MLAATNEDELRFRRAIRWATVIGALIFVPLLWSFGFNPLHRGLDGGEFSGFFDEQARALLNGHLNIPRGTAGIEGFIVEGREYLYYPPGPAILRMPIVAVTDYFHWRLTAPSMLLAWFVMAFIAGRLMWTVRQLLRPDAALGRWEMTMFGVLHVSLCAGSVVLFLGSMPWVYHEVYVWSIAMVLGAALALIRLALAPTRKTVVIFGLFVLGAVMVRATAGWGLALAAVLMAIWMWCGGFGAEGRRLSLWVALAGLGPLAIGVAINWAKFQHPYLFPLEKQVFTPMSPRRQRALAANGGDIVSFDLLPTTVTAYLRPNGIRFMSVFPFVSLPGRPATTVGDAVVDQPYRTGSVTTFMPLLLALTVWGAVTMFRTSTRAATRLLRVPYAAATLIASPIMIYGYIGYRYTSEFIPVLAIGSIVGMTHLVSVTVPWVRARRMLLLSAVSVLAAFGVVANMAAGVSLQHMSNPGPLLDRYVRAQLRFNDLIGGGLPDNILQVDELPNESVADQIAIVAECEGVFMGTGDIYGPWEPIAMREWSVAITISQDLPDGTIIDLGRVGHPVNTPSVGVSSSIGVEIADGQFRTHISRPDEVDLGEWTPFELDVPFMQEILVSVEHHVYSVEPAPEDHKVLAPFVVFANDLNTPMFFAPTNERPNGVEFEFTKRPNSSLCDELLALVEHD